MPEHNELTGSSLHEPKGLAALTGGAVDENKVYLSDGAGSGTWVYPSSLHVGAHISIGDITLNTTVTTLTDQDVWYPVAGLWTEDHIDDMTTVVATGRLVVVVGGDYQLDSTISFIASTSSDVLNLAYMVNGTKITPRIRRKIGTGADVGSMTIHNELHNLVAGEYIQLCVSTVSAEPDSFPAGATITVENGSSIATLIKVT